MTAETNDQDVRDDGSDVPSGCGQLRRLDTLLREPVWHFTIDTSESRPIYLPSIEDIQQECDLIKQQWTAQERHRRARADWQPVGWTVPKHTSVEQSAEADDE